MTAEALRSRIGSSLANRDFAEVESAWLEYAGLHPDESDYLISVARDLARLDKHALAGELLGTLAESLHDRGDASGCFAAAQAALKASVRAPGLRETLLKAYRLKYADRVDLDTFLEKAGLNTESGGLRQQVDALDRFLTFTEGSYVYHRGGWGYGQVAEFDADEEVMVVDFERKKNHRIGIQSANKILRCLPPDHIGVYRHYRAEELAQLMKDSPAQVFHIFLESHGRKATLKQVREEFVPAVLQKNEWSRWWTRAKKAILKDPAIRLGKGSSPLMELRDREKPIEIEIGDRMKARARITERVAVAREYMRTLDVTDAMAEVIGSIATETLGHPDLKTAERLALLYLKSDLPGEAAEIAKREARTIVAGIHDFHELFQSMDLADRKRVLADLASSKRDGWAEAMVDTLKSGDVELADFVYERLKKRRPDLMLTFLAEVGSDPLGSPDLYFWYVKGFFSGSIPAELAPGESQDTALERLLKLANHVGLEVKRSGDTGLKDFLRQIRAFLTARRLKLFDDYVETITLDRGRFLHAIIGRNRGLTDQTKAALLDSIEAKHPEARAVAAEAETHEDAVREDVIYTTIAGYHRREAEMRQIVDVEIPANAEDLGRAASFGDISENAEYSAALEKQALLMQKLGEIRSDLERATIVDPGEVPMDRVVIGTRVQVRNTGSGAEESYSILGPWDVDLSRGIISYLSPVGRGLLGHVVGETVEIDLPEGRAEYSILGIASAADEAAQA